MRLGYALALITGIFIPSVTQAQTWSESTTISADQSPIDIKLIGWGKASIKRAMTSEGKADTIRIGGVNHAVVAEKNGYRAFISIHDAVTGSSWYQDTIQNMAQKAFSSFSITTGDYFDLDYGAADFRLLPLSFSQNGKTISCAFYRAYWRQYAAHGYICAPADQPLSQEAAKTFVSHIAYRTALVPTNEGQLP